MNLSWVGLREEKEYDQNMFYNNFKLTIKKTKECLFLYVAARVMDAQAHENMAHKA